MARAVIPGAFGITRAHFQEIDDLIRSLRMGSKEFAKAMDVATQLMAHTTQGLALKAMTGRQYARPYSNVDVYFMTMRLPLFNCPAQFVIDYVHYIVTQPKRNHLRVFNLEVKNCQWQWNLLRQLVSRRI